MRFDKSGLTHEQLRDQLKDALARQEASVEKAETIVLDEGDRASSDSLGAFVLELLGRMQTGRIVLVTREVPGFVLDSAEIRKQTCFVPVNKQLMLSDYARLDEKTAFLEVRALGSGRVTLNGRSIDDWDGTLPRALFYYLVDRGMTTRSQIFETFWPNLSTREATNVFHVTKRKISEVLGVDLTTYWSGFYRIASNIDLQYDVFLFTEMVQNSAIAEPEEASRLLTYALSLYQGDFLRTVEADWVKRRRQEMQQMYGEALIGLGKLMEQAGKSREALGLYVRASATNRHREDLARSIMMLYRNLGWHEDAIATYRRLESELESALGVSPAPTLQELLAEIQAETERVH
ncbi:MAG: hypothetical protein HXY41_03205 [Chloroflexi bacterium]|nr:hypothetical protein [Chloroflexota bacterium]